MALIYDDGFRAYLNGTEIAAENVPIESSWNSAASVEFGAVQGQLPRHNINLDAHVDQLLSGENILAVHGMNVNPLDADFLFDVSLAANEVVSLSNQGFVTASPGEPNILRAAAKPVILGQQGPFFGATQLEMQLENSDPSIAIYYTLNGSEPTLNSQRYEAPNRLTQSAMLQARSIDTRANPQLAPSAVTAATFVAMSPELENRTSENHSQGSFES